MRRATARMIYTRRNSKALHGFVTGIIVVICLFVGYAFAAEPPQIQGTQHADGSVTISASDFARLTHGVEILYRDNQLFAAIVKAQQAKIDSMRCVAHEE